jgi:hypothetical protein
MDHSTFARCPDKHSAGTGFRTTSLHSPADLRLPAHRGAPDAMRSKPSIPPAAAVAPAPTSPGSPLALLALLPFLACCGGGGSGGSSGNLNQGSYDLASFTYVDPYPAGFQPLGSAVFRAARREEIAVLSATASGTGHAAAYDDAGQQFVQLGLFGPGLFGAGFVAAASACGDLDNVAGAELAVLGYRGGDLEVVALTTDSLGNWTSLGSFHVAAAVPSLAEVTLGVANLDGDDREELLVAATYAAGSGGWVRVFDDLQAGVTLRYNIDVAGCNLLQAMPCDFDVDGTQEILLFSREPGQALVRLVEGGGNQFAFRGDWTVIDPETRRVVVANLGAPAGIKDVPELAAFTIAQTPGYDRRFYWTIYRYEAGQFSSSGRGPTYWDGYPPREVKGLVAWDPDGDGLEEVAAALEYGNPGNYHVVVQLCVYPWRATHFSTRTIKVLTGTPGVSMTHLDADADGLEELALAYGPLNQNLCTDVVGFPEATPGVNQLTFRMQRTTPFAAGTLSAVVAAGDFDRENFVLRSTGRKWLDLPDPIPIVVMAAPPTKAGIGQNYGDSVTSYGTEQSIEQSHGVATGWSASFSVGVEASAVFDLFSVSAKQTLSAQMAKTLTESKKITWTKTYSGSYDADVIVFQGTLYEIYEYEIVSAANPLLVGSKVTLNDPVATKTFKWTLDFYNQTVVERARIGQDVVTHALGDPASYRRKAAAQSLLLQRCGWIDEAGLQVGQGTGSNATSVTITSSNSSETSRCFGVTWESEVKVGGATIGGSFGLTSEEIYGVTVETGTTYAGQIGDIANAPEWSSWFYGCGLLVYRHGADANGEPLPGARPFHVVTYWVDPLGSSYTAP